MKIKCEKAEISGRGHSSIEVEIHNLDLRAFVEEMSPIKIDKLLDLIGETRVAQHFNFDLQDESA